MSETDIRRGARQNILEARLNQLKEPVQWDSIQGKPTSMPASDVYPWAKASDKPAYTASEVGAVAVDDRYKIGAIYMSEDATSPATLFGGTWSAITAGRFLVAAGMGYAVGSTGGSESIQLGLSAGYAKVGYLVANHIHLKTKSVPTGAAYETYINATTYRFSDNVGGSGTELGGTTDSGDNRPPYQPVYMWRKTA